jgi:hypothetical protein
MVEKKRLPMLDRILTELEKENQINTRVEIYHLDDKDDPEQKKTFVEITEALSKDFVIEEIKTTTNEKCFTIDYVTTFFLTRKIPCTNKFNHACC